MDTRSTIPQRPGVRPVDTRAFEHAGEATLVARLTAELAAANATVCALRREVARLRSANAALRGAR